MLTGILTTGSACISDKLESHTVHIARYSWEDGHGTPRTDEPQGRAARTLRDRIHVVQVTAVPSAGPALVSQAEQVELGPCHGQRDTGLDQPVCSRPTARIDTAAISHRTCSKIPRRTDS
jgi:hypothetical protein